MSWETRGNNRYYYRRRKVNGRVVAEYFGAGAIGILAAHVDENERDERITAAADWHATIEHERRISAEVAEVDEVVRAAVAAVLIANGYHTHRRQWRKVRNVPKCRTKGVRGVESLQP